MKKGRVLIIIVIVLILVYFFLSYGINWLFSSQYNENGVSHFLVVTVDKSQPKEFIGELDNHRIYVDKFNLNETNFRNINAQNVSIKKAIEEKLVSISEWKKYAWKKVKNGDTEIMIFDNYEIACTYNDCIIRPKLK